MRIPGWDVAEDDGLFTCTRQAELTEYQVMYGALSLLETRDEGELYLLCDAQIRLAERLATAEIVARTAQLRRLREVSS